MLWVGDKLLEATIRHVSVSLQCVINLYSDISVLTVTVKPACLVFDNSACTCFSLLLQLNKNIFEKKEY